MISETKINEKFPLSHFKIDAFNLPFRLDRSSSGVGRGIMPFIWEEISRKN